MGRKRKWCDEDLIRVVPYSNSIYEVFRRLDLKIGGGAHALIKRRIQELEIDTSHFDRSKWVSTETRRAAASIPLEEILVENSLYDKTHALKLRLIREGLKQHCCELCGLVEWMGSLIPIELHHVNGVRSDNRFENLQILCPNCHAQTDTYCGKNINRG